MLSSPQDVTTCICIHFYGFPDSLISMKALYRGLCNWQVFFLLPYFFSFRRASVAGRHVNSSGCGQLIGLLILLISLILDTDNLNNSKYKIFFIYHRYCKMFVNALATNCHICKKQSFSIQTATWFVCYFFPFSRALRQPGPFTAVIIVQVNQRASFISLITSSDTCRINSQLNSQPGHTS